VVMSGMEPEDMVAKQNNLDKTNQKWHCVKKNEDQVDTEMAYYDVYYNWAKKPAQCCKKLDS
jgi:hypothetical protein